MKGYHSMRKSKNSSENGITRKAALNKGAASASALGRSLERKLSRMGRREYMQTLAALGVSASTLRYGTQKGLAAASSDPKREIPYVAYLEVVSKEPGEPPVREPIYETIARDEWAARHAAINARDDVSRLLKRQNRFEGVSIAATGMDQSPTGFGVKVQVPVGGDKLGIESPGSTIRDIKELVPSAVDVSVAHGRYSETFRNIPVRVKKSNVRLTACARCQQENERKYIPGGTPIYVPGTDSEPTNDGSVTGSFQHSDYGEGWITASHVVYNREGEEVHQAGDKIGDVKQTYNDNEDIDCAFIKPTSTEKVTSNIATANNDGIDMRISGIVTNSTIENNIGNTDYRVKSQGQTTCRNDGYIQDTYGIWGGTSAVGTSNEVDPGDSGGALFHIDSNDTAKIVGNIFAERGPEESDSDLEDCGKYKYCEGTTSKTIEGTLDGYFY